MPRLERIRQASSTTTIRFALRSSVSASIIACSQAVAQVIRIPSAVVCVLRTARRLSTTSGASRSRPGVVGPSNMPRRFPVQSWSSAKAIGRTTFAMLVDVHRERLGHLGGRVDEHVDDVGQRRLAVRSGASSTTSASCAARFSSGVSGRSSAAAATE